MLLQEATAPTATGRARLYAAAPAVAAAAVVMLVLARYEVPVLDIARYAAYLFLVVLLPGRLIWRVTGGRGRDPEVPGARIEEWVLGATAGYTLELVSYCLARWAGVPLAYLAAPLLVVLLLARPTARTPIAASARSLTPRVAWGLAGVVSFLAVHLAVKVFSAYRLEPYRLYDVDESFQLALVGELRHHFPPEYPYVEAGRLTYQWFVHAHMAASTWATGLDPVMVYRRFDVLALATIAVLGISAVVVRITGRAWPGLVAAGLMVLVGSFDVTGVVPGEAAPEDRFLETGILINSPTQTFAFALLPTVALLCLRLLHEPRTRVLVGSSAVALSLAAGVKATVVPVVLAGYVTVVAVAILRRRRPPEGALVGTGVTALVLLASSVVLYAGDAHSLTWDPTDTVEYFTEALGMKGSGAAAGPLLALSLLVMWNVSGATGLWLLTRVETRWDPRVWWLLGASAAGYGATLLLGHAGGSQLYFGRTVAPLVSVLAAWGLSEIFPVGTSTGRAVRAVATALSGGVALLAIRTLTEAWPSGRTEVEGVATTVLRAWVNLPVILVIVVGFFAIRLVARDLTKGRVALSMSWLLVLLVGLGSARTMAFVSGTYPPAGPGTAATVITPGGPQAAAWLRENSAANDRVITNAHCLSRPDLPPGRCDSRHFWMSGLSERRFVIEGWAYTRFSEDWLVSYWGDQTLLRLHDEFFAQPTEARLTVLLARTDAQWLWFEDGDGRRVAELEQLPRLRKVFQSGDSTIFEVLPA